MRLKPAPSYRVTTAGRFQSLKLFTQIVNILELVTSQGAVLNELLPKDDVNLHLEQTKLIASRKALAFKKSVSMYREDTKSDTSQEKFAFWPLIRLVKLYLKEGYSFHGIVLVDLP